jgi:antitoxin (DNA-binding transcriptional repressor) of toxin-antitoxin stability system
MSNINIPASDFRVNFTQHILAVKSGSTVIVEKHGKPIAMMIAADAVSTPDMSVTATKVRVNFTRILKDLSAGSTFHITKHKTVLASLVAPDFAVSEPTIEEPEVVEVAEIVEVDAPQSAPAEKPVRTKRLTSIVDLGDDDDMFDDTGIDVEDEEEDDDTPLTALLIDISEKTLDEAADSDDDHDWLDEAHDDVYDAFFAELAKCRNTRMQRRATTV